MNFCVHKGIFISPSLLPSSCGWWASSSFSLALWKYYLTSSCIYCFWYHPVSRFFMVIYLPLWYLLAFHLSLCCIKVSSSCGEGTGFLLSILALISCLAYILKILDTYFVKYSISSLSPVDSFRFLKEFGTSGTILYSFHFCFIFLPDRKVDWADGKISSPTPNI